MKKSFYIAMTSLLAALLSGCFGSGHSADPPANFIPTAGDGRVKLDWDSTSGVEYWVFSATDPGLTAFNWTGLANARGYSSAVAPFYVCGLLDGTRYYFAANGRVDGGPGGTSSPTVNAQPYNASTAWASGVTFTAADLLGVGYAGLTTCGNNAAISSSGLFAAVGAGGAIFTSSDGKSWTPVNSPTTSDLFAVTGYAANQNNVLTPALRWMAVGDAGAVVYYLEGTGWVDAKTYFKASTLTLANPGNNPLRSITQVGGTFYAVGDAGTIISSSDAINWTHRPNALPNVTTANLNGVAYGGSIYVAVGNEGTLLTSGDGNTWAVPTPISPNTLPITPAIPAGINLQKVAAFVSNYGNIYVAVGDGGTIVTRTSYNYNNNSNWTAQTLPGAPNLVGITAELRAVDTTTTPPVDTALGFVSTVQFVAVDSAGNAYTSVNGYDWSLVPVSTGTTSTGATSLNALVSSGFGYLAVGNLGVNAYAF